LSGSFRCTLAVIVRNEIIGARGTFHRIPWAKFDQAVVVDGNSNDGTAEFYRENGITVITQTRPGLGAAMMDARHVCETDAIVFFHPDGNEDPADTVTIRDLLADNRDFVVASRMIKGSWNEEDEKIFKTRKWANQGFALIANVIWGRKGNRTSDVTNGLRGIRVDAWDRLKLTSTDCTLDFQMVIRALRTRVPITEFPTREGHRIAGATNFASVDTGLKELKLIARELVRRD
jgi:glycosyltransferase involved in cell wall biosynthesis